jgi:hypothetical protein
MKRGKDNFINNLKKSLQFRVVAIELSILLFLVLYVVFNDNINQNNLSLSGEFNTLKWDFNRDNVRLEVLSYNISQNNLSIIVNVNWSSGNEELNSLFFSFDRDVDCNYTTTDLMSFGQNKTYNIDATSTSCQNFSNLISVPIYGRVNIHLKQIKKIENINVYKDEGLKNKINLSEYFICLENLSFSFTESPENNMISMEINTTTNFVSFYPVVNWYGSQRFNLTSIFCESPDPNSDETLNGNENSSFVFTYLNENKPIPNQAPVFLSRCDNLDIEKNKSLIIAMKTCFRDDDNDSLIFRYDNSSMQNITVNRNNTNLTLVPNTGFIGLNYLYLYANDSKTEITSSRIRITVYETITTHKACVNNSCKTVIGPGTDECSVLNQACVNTSTMPKIISSTSGTKVSMFSNQNKSFFISAQNYDDIEWYLDERIVGNSLSYTASNLKIGNYTLSVKVIKGVSLDSKTWKLVVKDDESKTIRLISPGKLVLYVIIIIVVILIVLIIGFIIFNKKPKEVMGFGIETRGDNSSTDMNIPGRILYS